MGVTFVIGQAAMRVPASAEAQGELAVRVVADRGRSMSFSFGAIADLARAAGVADLLVHDPGGQPRPTLAAERPGAYLLTPSALERFEAGLESVVERFGDDAPEAAAMRWFVDSTRWALRSFVTPVIQNE